MYLHAEGLSCTHRRRGGIFLGSLTLQVFSVTKGEFSMCRTYPKLRNSILCCLFFVGTLLLLVGCGNSSTPSGQPASTPTTPGSTPTATKSGYIVLAPSPTVTLTVAASPTATTAATPAPTNAPAPTPAPANPNVGISSNLLFWLVVAIVLIALLSALAYRGPWRRSWRDEPPPPAEI